MQSERVWRLHPTVLSQLIVDLIVTRWLQVSAYQPCVQSEGVWRWHPTVLSQLIVDLIVTRWLQVMGSYQQGVFAPVLVGSWQQCVFSQLLVGSSSVHCLAVSCG